MTKPNAAPIDLRRRLWVPVLLAVCLSGCSYYTQLAQGHLALLRQREPVAAVLADETRSPTLRRRLAQTQQARDFASAVLQLPDNGSYRSYAEIGRPFVVWNLFATERYSVEPLQHCFPVAGCVAYRGYYREAAARAAAARLRLEGKDVQVAGVDAYSTLGWFDDPLLSAMLRRDDEQLAGLIFHELAHQQLYVPGDTTFNESYASFVEREGLRQWQRSRGFLAPDARRQARYRELVQLLLATRERLREGYARNLPEAELAALKQAEFSRLRRDYRALRDQHWGGDRRFDRFFEQPLNNASLVPFGLYDGWVPAFAALYRQRDGDWAAFHRAAAELARLPAAERNRRLARLAEAQAQR